MLDQSGPSRIRTTQQYTPSNRGLLCILVAHFAIGRIAFANHFVEGHEFEWLALARCLKGERLFDSPVLRESRLDVKRDKPV